MAEIPEDASTSSGSEAEDAPVRLLEDFAVSGESLFTMHGRHLPCTRFCKLNKCSNMAQII